jgi:hypothetical protein
MRRLGDVLQIQIEMFARLAQRLADVNVGRQAGFRRPQRGQFVVLGSGPFVN